MNMEIKDLGIIDKKVRQFEKVGIRTAEDLLEFYPRKYKDRRSPTGILPPDQESVFYMVPQKVTRKFGKPDFVLVTGVLSNSTIPVKVIWFNQAYLYDRLLNMVGMNVLVCGVAAPKSFRGEFYYEVSSPAVFDAGDDALGIYPVYRNIPGMAADYLRNTLEKAAGQILPMREN